MNRRLSAVLFAALVVASTAIAGVGAAGISAGEAAPASFAQEEPTNNSTFDPAREVYVRENGDAVFVYGNDSGDAPRQLEFGLDVSEGLMHALVVNQSDTDEFNGTFDGNLVMSPSSIAGNASFETVRPESIQSLAVDLTGEQTEEDARFDLTVDGTLSSREAPAAALVESAETSGSLTVGASKLTSAGEARATLSTPLGQEALHDFSISESDGDYTVTAEQAYAVYEYNADRWDTSERAKATLQAQYATLARSLGGQGEVTLDSYSFTRTGAEGTYRLQIAYTIEYTGIDAGLERVLAQQLADSEEYDLTRAEAESIAARLTELNVDDASARYQLQGTQLDASYSLSLSNYDAATLALLEVAGSMDLEGQNASVRLEEVRKHIEAQRAADLTRTYEWEGSLTKPSAQETAVSFALTYRTQNWGDYVAELKSRDVDPAAFTYEAHAATEGDRVTAEMAMEVEQEALVKDTADQLLALTKPGEDEEMDEDARQTRKLIRAFKESDFQKARMDVSVGDGTVRVELGADFEDLSSFRDVLAETEGLPEITQVVGRTEDDGANVYVHAAGAFPRNATEEDVRASVLVDSETTVHLPGEWNRTFPEMDRKRAAEYLGIAYETPASPDDATDTAGPGFGAVAAVLALLAVAALARKE